MKLEDLSPATVDTILVALDTCYQAVQTGPREQIVRYGAALSEVQRVLDGEGAP